MGYPFVLNIPLVYFSAQVEKFLEKGEEDNISLAPCSAFQRKLTYQAVNAKYVL